MAARLLEVCVESCEDALGAARAGADRIEYCSSLRLGGLTPTPGALFRLREVPLPCMVMIRPRPGDFVYSATEIETMKREIAFARAQGAAGVVFGVAKKTGDLDQPALRDLMTHCQGLETTLHRVFDEVPEQIAALELAVEIGFDRILTSGGRETAFAGRRRIEHLVTRAAGRIVILPGSGVNSENAAQLIDVTGATELHASCKVTAGAAGYAGTRTIVDPGKVRGLVAAIGSSAP